MTDLINNLIEYVNNQNQRIINLEHNFNKINLTVDLLKNINKSYSQYNQDLFVLKYLNNLNNGFFVDFGATDGITLSNSYLLEKNYNWKGILAEPAKLWHQNLFTNRQVHIDTRCVWTNSNQLINFSESSTAELSTITKFISSDIHSKHRNENNIIYDVMTISLNDLLEFYNAPTTIDYLSIDTEGSEFSILNVFNFDKYRFRVITVEHNWTSNRDKLYELLSSRNYKRVHFNLTDCDDWYVYNF